MIKGEKFAKVALFALIGMVVLDRALLLWRMSSKWIDDDQAIMWLAGHELLHGRLHQPHFFGQAYNTVFEGWLAAPMVLLGIPYEYAVPLVTILFAIFPFLVFSILGLRRGNSAGAILCLTYLLTLPLEYAFIASMPRGFMTGIAFASAAAALLLFFEPVFWRICAGFFLIFFSFSVNPSAALLGTPVALTFVPKIMKSVKMCAAAGAGLIAGGVVHLLARLFYVYHPDYNGYRLRGLSWQISSFYEGIMKSRAFFDAFSPIGLPGLLLIVAVVSLVAMHKRAWAGFSILLTGSVISLVSLGLVKVLDGSDYIFYPYLRPFLAVPVLVGLALSLIPFGESRKSFALALVLVSAIACTWRQLEMDSLSGSIRHTPPRSVRVMPVAQLKIECARLRELGQQYQAEVVVVAEGARGKIMNYACPALEPLLPPTLLPRSERRRWRMVEELASTRSRILFYDVRGGFEQRAADAALDAKKVLESPASYIIIGAPVEVVTLSRRLLPRQGKKKLRSNPGDQV